MRKQWKWMIVLTLMLAAMSLAIPQMAKAESVNVQVMNRMTADVDVRVGDIGYIQPVIESITDSSGQPAVVAWWSYSSYDEDIITVGQDGRYNAISPGSTTVLVKGYSAYGDTLFSANCYFDVSFNMEGVTLETNRIKGYIVGYESFSADIKINSIYPIDGENSELSYQSSDSNISVRCSLSDNTLHVECYSSGSTTLTVAINGKSFVLHIDISKLEISKRSYVTSKGKSFKLKVKGTSEKIKWNSSNSRVVKVSAKGIVKCRKKGNAVITATVGGKRVGCAVSVISSKLLKVIKRAKKIGSTWKYSQPKRMQTGYYDCSSLVWKSYSRMGKKFGMANYAPVAADLAKWCKQHGKTLSKSYTSGQIQKMKFMPGDLMFETGQNNGRYKGIYHVEMFVGYSVSYYDEAGKPVLLELWAARPEGYYGGGGLMMRP